MATATKIHTTIPHRFLGGEGHGNPSIAPKLQHTWGTTMNSEIKIQFGGKQGEERNLDRFLERNDEDRRRHTLVSLLFSSLPLPLSFLDLVTAKVDGTRRGDGFRVWRGWALLHVTVELLYRSVL